MFLQLLTFLISVIIGSFIIFQIILPIIQDAPLFPFFSKRRKVENEIGKEEEALDVLKEEKKLNNLKKKRQENIN